MSLHSECTGKAGRRVPQDSSRGQEWCFFEDAPTGLAKVSEGGICLRLNRRLRTLLGQEEAEDRETKTEEHEGVPLESLVPPEDAAIGRRVRGNLLRGEATEGAWISR